VEEDLIRKAIARDGNAIEALYDRYAPALLSVCLRYCGNRDDAEDTLHDGFIKIIQKVHTFKIRSEGSLEAWMRRIMVNTALNFLRSREKEKYFTDIDGILDRTDLQQQDDPDPEDIYLEVDRETIMQMICELPSGYRTVFNLFVFEEYGHREIATMLNCTENTSKSQLSKARAMLRRKMNELVNANTAKIYEKI
jgi:RNA polymerase sigma-70 factor (ECF subfamily)